MALSPYDVVQHARMIQDNSTWDADRCITLTVSFTPGSCALTAYKTTQQGFEWGRQNRENLNPQQGFSAAFYERMQLILSDQFLGFFMVPDNQMWNYNFVGLGLV